MSVRSGERPPRLELPTTTSNYGGLSSYIASWAKTHDPIFACPARVGPWAGRAPVYLAGPDANRFVLRSGVNVLSRELGWQPVLGDRLGQGLINLDCPDDHDVRAVLRPAFSSERVAQWLPSIANIVDAHIADWRSGAEVDITQVLGEIAFDVAVGVVLGLSRGTESARLKTALDVVMGTAPAARRETRSDGERDGSARELRALLAHISQRRADCTDRAFGGPAAVDLLDAARRNGVLRLSDEQLVEHLSILIVAGYETTTTLGSWLVYELATRPEYGTAIDDEIELTAPADRAPIMENVIREVARLHPPVVFLPRVALTDVEFDGYVIPAGTPVFLSVGGGQRLSSVFADPEEFRPERFARVQGAESEIGPGLAMFGGGHRPCLGARLAVAELKTFVRQMRGRHRLSIANGAVRAVETVVQWLPDGLVVRIE